MTAKWKGGGNGSRIAIPARIPLIVYPVIQSSITMRCQLVLLIALCAAAFAIQPAAAVDFTVVHINDNHAR
jgi:2',3'-cyclic-nucleotide 2'-phosphodiesterase (5'-nucleotidase family)